MTDRLFAVWPTPTERAALRRVNRARADTLFALDLEAPADQDQPCAACGGAPDVCTCARTGAVALVLVDPDPPTESETP
jgi:hypothetical protein